MPTSLIWKRVVWSIVTILLLTTSASIGDQARVKVVSPSEVTFSGNSPMLGAIKVRMQLYGIRQTKLTPTVREWGWWCGSAGVDVAIRSLEVWLNNHRVRIPINAYTNLLNIEPVTMTLREEQDKLFMYIKGGDGAEHYETRIEIAGGRVKQRETIGSEFKYPQAPYERITFNADGTSSYSITDSIPRQLTTPSRSKIQLTRKESG